MVSTAPKILLRFIMYKKWIQENNDASTDVCGLMFVPYRNYNLLKCGMFLAVGYLPILRAILFSNVQGMLFV